MATPTDDSYSCPLNGVVAAGRFAFFSGGSAVGSYNAGTQVWTPGRDANGVVTRASWALVPTDGTWVEVAGTAFTTQVQTLLTAALPGYSPPGSLTSVLNAYNGFAIDYSSGRAVAHGGGHQDGANNGLYPFALKKMAWSILKLPDMQTYWPVNYKTNPPRDNSYTVYTNAKDAVDVDPTTTAFYHDEFYDPLEPLANTRNPTARHTYNAMTFHNGKLRHGVRRYWEWDEATGIWSAKFPFGKNATTHTLSGGGYCGEMVKGTFDEVNNRYICGPSWASGAPQNFWQFDVSTEQFSLPSGFPSSWEAYHAAGCRMGRKMVFFARPTNNSADFWPPRIRVTDLDSGTMSTVWLSGIVQSRCSQKSGESVVLEWVPAVGKLLLLMGYDKDDIYDATANYPLVAFWIDPVTGEAAIEDQSGKWPSLWTYSLVKNKIFYMPQMRSLVMFPDATSNARIRRF